MPHPTLPLLLVMLLASSPPAGRGSAGADRDRDLRVGEPAPRLQVERWLKGEPLDRLEPGKVYVVDIWAPWCGPCLGGMAHLSDLQDQHRGRGLVVIGLSSEDDYGSTREKAEAVVAKQGDAIRYRIAWDRGRATYDRWMAREKGNGWPWCFVVGRDGRVAWSGHPERLDGVLDRVLAGTWNRDSAAAVWQRQVRGNEMADSFYVAYRNRRDPEAERRWRELRAFAPTLAASYAPHYFKLLLLRLDRRADAYAFAERERRDLLREAAEPLARIVDVVTDDGTPAKMRDLDVALACARTADAIARPADPLPRVALARVHALRGEWDAAVAALSRAEAVADSAQSVTIRESLRRYRARQL